MARVPRRLALSAPRAQANPRIRIEESMKNTSKRTRGFTLVELLVVMAIIALLISILMPALARARANAMLMKDSARQKGLHQAWISAAKGDQGRFPTPGLYDRNPVTALGNRDIPGRGSEAIMHNTTPNVHSVCIMHNFYSTSDTISPAELNVMVTEYDEYDYDAYKPYAPDGEEDVYWDPTFAGNLSETGRGCNFSDASIPLFGDRKSRQWKASGDSSFVALSTRGTPFGEFLEKSTTYEFFGHPDSWMGNICYQDNHVETEESFYPEMLVLSGVSSDTGERIHVPDSLFNIECTSGVCDFWGADTWMVIYTSIEPTDNADQPGGDPGSSIQWDDQ